MKLLVSSSLVLLLCWAHFSHSAKLEGSEPSSARDLICSALVEANQQFVTTVYNRLSETIHQLIDDNTGEEELLTRLNQLLYDLDSAIVEYNLCILAATDPPVGCIGKIAACLATFLMQVADIMQILQNLGLLQLNVLNIL